MKEGKGLKNLREVEVVITDIHCYRPSTFNGGRGEVKESQKGQRKISTVILLKLKEVTAPSRRCAQFCEIWQRAK